jgi:hypothetical protein
MHTLQRIKNALQNIDVAPHICVGKLSSSVAGYMDDNE